MNIPEITFPNEDKDFIKNPYPYLKELRNSSPIHYDKLSGLNLITHFEDVKEIQKSKNFSSSEPEDYVKDSDEKLINPKDYDYFWKTEEFNLLNLEGNIHDELRGLVAKAFLNRQVQELRPFMETKSNELLNKINHEKFDLLADYAQPYSIAVIGELLGVPEEDYEKFLYWSHAIVKMYDLKVSDENATEAEAAAKDFYIYMSDLIDEKNNMIDITNKIPFRLIELIKKMRYIFGDDLVIDKSISGDIEDIYEYIIEKAYERPEYIFEELKFKDNAKQKLLIAFNKFFWNKI